MKRTFEFSDLKNKSFLKIYHTILGQEFDFHSKSTNIQLYENNRLVPFFDDRIELFIHAQNFKKSMFQYKLHNEIKKLKVVLESSSSDYNLDELTVDLI